MNKSVVATSIVIALLSGCATQPTATNSAQLVPAKQIINSDIVKPANGAGEVVVKRDSGFRGSACAIRIHSDGQPVADLWSGEKIVFYVPEGEHIISASTCGGGMVETQANVKAAKPSIYRVGFGVGFELGIFPTAF